MIEYLIKLIVDFASINTLRKQSFNGIPWNFLWRKIGSSLKIVANTCTISMYVIKQRLIIICHSLSVEKQNCYFPQKINYHSNRVNPGIKHVTGHFQVRLGKLVFLGPSKGRVSHPLLYNSMEPGQQEVETGSLIGSLSTDTELANYIWHRNICW